jgi:23S rRNA pseudouridine1911/1915/1917 synthase
MIDPPRWVVPAALEGERLDRALALLGGLSRSEVAGLVTAGHVRLGHRLVDGQVVGARTVGTRSVRVHAGDIVQLDGPLDLLAGRSAALEGDPAVDVTVVWSDEDLIVVDKPAGLVVHPGAGNRAGTMVQGLLARFPELAEMAEPADAADRPGIVHRLDRGTSGLLVVARNRPARLALSAALAERRVERVYRCLAAGTVEADQGVIDAPIGRSRSSPTSMVVRADGRAARTRYLVVARSELCGPVSLLECRLDSGRTHQIRVHLAAIGHPVLGDDRYGGRAGTLRSVWSRLPPGRQALHASTLALAHPRTGAPLRFDSPMPGDLRALMAELGLGAG